MKTERTGTRTRRPVQPAGPPAVARGGPGDTPPERRSLPAVGSPAHRGGRPRPLSGRPAGAAAGVAAGVGPMRAGMPRAAVPGGPSRSGAGGAGPVGPRPLPTVVATPVVAGPGDQKVSGRLRVTAHQPGAHSAKGRLRPAPLVARAPAGAPRAG